MPDHDYTVSQNRYSVTLIHRNLYIEAVRMVYYHRWNLFVRRSNVVYIRIAKYVKWRPRRFRQAQPQPLLVRLVRYIRSYMSRHYAEMVKQPRKTFHTMNNQIYQLSTSCRTVTRHTALHNGGRFQIPTSSAQ